MAAERPYSTRAASYAVIDDLGSVYIQRRKSGKFRGRWELPGGIVRVGETRTEAAIRETREENNLNVEAKSKPIYISSDVNPNTNLITNRFIVWCAPSPMHQFPQLGPDHDDIRMVNPYNINPRNSDFTPASQKVLRHIQSEQADKKSNVKQLRGVIGKQAA